MKDTFKISQRSSHLHLFVDMDVMAVRNIISLKLDLNQVLSYQASMPM